MTELAQSSAVPLESRLEFETLLADLSSRFVNVPSHEVEREIEDAQRRVCQCLDIDLSNVWQWPPGNPDDLTMTHLYRPLGGPPVPESMNGLDYFPWCLAELKAGRPVRFTSLDELPPEAARDRAVYEYFGIRSTLTLPLTVGGEPIHGCLGFNMTRFERGWPDQIVQRLQLVAEVFANALVRKRADEALRVSEARLSLAADAARVGLWTLDYGTGVFWATDRARMIFGYPPDVVISLELFESSIIPEHLRLVRDAIERSALTGAALRADYQIRRTDGSVRWISSSGRPQVSPTGEPLRLMGVSTDVTEVKRSEEMMRHLSQRLILAHEEERALLARELHDDVTQRLAVLAIEVGRAELAECNADHAQVMRSVREALVRLSEDIHALAYQLHPSVLDELGLAAALRAECERRRRQGNLALHLTVDPLPSLVDREVALCLFRVTQEALNNVARHAGTATATVTLREMEEGLILEVRDDGVGFDPSRPAKRRSLGLASIRERVRLVNGTLDVESAPGQGTAVVAWVPLGGASQ